MVAEQSHEALLGAAEQALAQGRDQDAASLFRRLVAQPQVIDYEYDAWAQRLAELYERLGRRREAGVLYLYLHYFESARRVLEPGSDAELIGHLDGLEGLPSQAAARYLEAGCPVQAAIAFEEAGQPEAAVEQWEGLVKSQRVANRAYERALLHTNLGLARRRVQPHDRQLVAADLIEAQRLLEEVADEFETMGLRERSFDCYHILIQLGREGGSFENLSEGYLNCIRVLRADGLKFYVLQFYEDFIRLAIERRELHAAATLYREAAQYAVQMGLPYHRHYQRRAAETWRQTAVQAVSRGQPIEVVENALRGAADAFATAGDLLRVRDIFEELAALELPERRQKRYHTIAAKYVEVGPDARDAPEFPEYLRQPHAYARVWFLDLVEWELGGDPERIALSMIGDRKVPAAFRRRAVTLALEAADARRAGSERQLGPLLLIAQRLGELQTYGALSALERLYQHPSSAVRRAVLAALRLLPFKRSLSLLARGLADSDQEVRDAAVVALRSLHFAHALESLIRIYRDHPEERVKTAALQSIGRILTLEAGEFLLGVLRFEPERYRKMARTALAAFDSPWLVPVLQEHARLETDPRIRQELIELSRRTSRR